MNITLKKIMINKINKLALAICVMGLTGGAWAATDTANLAVSARVENACAIGPGTLDFGTLALDVNAGLGTVTGANHDASTGSSISIACTKDAAASITAGLGSNASSSIRRMDSAGDKLAYELYTSTLRDTVLDTTTGSIAYTGTGEATTATTIYGRITGAQLAAAKKGNYTDTVAMTITYTP